jgi:RNase P/RNase MRP subunit p29
MAVPGVQVTVDDVGIKTDANTVKIDGTTNTVKIDGTTNTVKIDGTTNTVKIDATDNTVKIDATDNTVKIDGTTNTVKIDGTDNTVKIDGSVQTSAINQLDWLVTDSDTNAVAAATKAAETGKQHGVQVILAGYSDLTVVGTVTLKFGSTAQFVQPLVGAVQIILPGYLLGADNEAVSVELSAGGESKVGYVTIIGTTIPAPAPPPEP